jgi:hypothetical protein
MRGMDSHGAMLNAFVEKRKPQPTPILIPQKPIPPEELINVTDASQR